MLFIRLKKNLSLINFYLKNLSTFYINKNFQYCNFNNFLMNEIIEIENYIHFSHYDQ